MIKILACLFMIIDHIGYLTDNLLLRIIGRLSMPIFAYCIYTGFLHTRNLKKYIISMMILAFVSQVPYMYFGGTGLNICFSWLLSLVLLFLISDKSNTSRAIIVTLFALISIMLKLEYNVMALLTPVFYYFFNANTSKKWDKVGLAFICLWGLYVVIPSSVIVEFKMLQVFYVFALPIIAYCKNFKFVNVNKYIFYLFYPMQFIVLKLIF